MTARRRIEALEQRAQARGRQRDPLVLLLPVFGENDPLRIGGDGVIVCPSVTVRQVEVFKTVAGTAAE